MGFFLDERCTGGADEQQRQTGRRRGEVASRWDDRDHRAAAAASISARFDRDEPTALARGQRPAHLP
ncbi:hypothetical protein [Sorangium sp. So ce233]|uniref:hypothetical protein n=1 Tax=Sorangium sp. So ce233 TaxID=3133290 RepID=UPI003F635A3E